ncbi:MAG: helix-turn-helix transcriptional regulator [Clostridia bacterium]|nr:helix-turn-helix transcriptional regulator [Clostridia bacterium]
MFDMARIGATIARHRKENNMTQMELADLMGISFQAVSNWERGVSHR